MKKNTTYNQKKSEFKKMVTCPGELVIPEKTEVIQLMNSLDSLSVKLEKNSKLKFIVIQPVTSGRSPKNSVQIKFRLAEKSELHFIALIAGRGTAKYFLETTAVHEAPMSQAYFDVRSALCDQSKIDYRGNLVIAEKAARTDAYLRHRTILLSPAAHAYSRPTLEIETNDVKVGHAASIGRPDRETLYYLKSRGFSEIESEKIIVESFFRDIIEKNMPEDLQQILLVHIAGLVKDLFN